MSAGPMAEPITGKRVIGDEQHGPTGMKESLAGRPATPRKGQAGREWTATLHGALWIGGLDLALVVLLGKCRDPGITILALPGIGIITFLGILVLCHNRNGRAGFNKAEMRCAIAATFMVVYFTMLGVLLFSGMEPSQSATTLINNFTYLVGVVVVFYFGSTAVVEHATAKYRRIGAGLNNQTPSPSR